MNYYLIEKNDVLKAVGSRDEGLLLSESSERLAANGKNRLDEGKRISPLSRFLSQFKDPMILILIAAAAVSGFMAILRREPEPDAVIILLVVILNALLGVYQESKAEKAIEALQEMAAATTKVLRGGTVTEIKSEYLVVGDVVLLEAGDAIPADGRILESVSLKIEEAALTGESVPVNKTVGALGVERDRAVSLGDRKNMVYMGSTVVYGRGRAVVTAAGMDTEMGKIAHALSKAKENKTPLQMKLAQLSKTLTLLVVGISAFIFAFSLFRAGNLEGKTMFDTFMIAISLAVAAIPEGLAMVMTIVLSVGVTNMSRKNAIIRKLTAVETLGCAQIICSDKTGTLTQNKMTVVERYGDEVPLLVSALALCSDAEPDETGEARGEPTESALVDYARKEGFPKDELKRKAPRIGEAPFDSMRKMMSTVHETEGRVVQFTKGAPDEVLRHCAFYRQGGKTLPMTNGKKSEILDANRNMADKALRVLCAATRVYEKKPESFEARALETDLTFLGLVGMIDPVRPEVSDAIERCKTAGIRAVMITGDHKNTAVAIASQLGMITDAAQAITGAELDTISDERFIRDVEQYGVYARVQPEHKARIVGAWQKRGYVTAMTGDGVNDAPSIKVADIGVGMGITGTDVTKNVADMVLADDNFATIVGAVEEGRRIYDNIRKAIQFLLGSNLSEVVSIFFATVMGFVILKPVHLLWINLITDSLPALSLGMEKGEADLMKRAPRNPKDGIFSGGLGADVIYQGLLVAALTVAAYLIGHRFESGVWEITHSADGITMAFLTMSMAEIFHSFNMRSQRGSVLRMKDHNLFLWGAAALSFALTTAVIWLPFLARAFDFTPISLAEYLIAMGLAVSVIPLVEGVKLLQRRVKK